jgi:putative transposase
MKQNRTPNPEGVEFTAQPMSTYTQILYHIVFSTKDRCPCFHSDGREELFKYIWGVIKNKKCKLFRINGVKDHLHILTDLHPSVCLADLVKAIKVSSSIWIKEKGDFPRFKAWQKGYGGFTHSIKEKSALIEYVKNQEAHHKNMSFIDELKTLLREAGIEFNGKYLD